MGEKVYKYLVGGIVYKTSIEFPEFIETTLPHTTIVEYGNVPERLENQIDARALIAANDKDEVLFTMPKVARFLIEGTHTVTIELIDTSKKSDAEKYMLTFVLGMISYKMKYFPLHGGGVVYNNEAYLFTGLSGAGKSTTIAALKDAGFKILGDDIANLFLEGKEVYMHPCFPRFKLWEESLEMLNLKNTNEYQLKSDINKYLVPVGENFSEMPIKVKRIYHLQEDREGNFSFLVKKGPEKLNLLKSNSYKPWAVKLFGFQKEHFALMNQMLPFIEWVEFRRPKDKLKFEEMKSLLINHIKNE